MHNCLYSACMVITRIRIVYSIVHKHFDIKKLYIKWKTKQKMTQDRNNSNILNGIILKNMTQDRNNSNIQ
jgi:hypothetical protein